MDDRTRNRIRDQVRNQILQAFCLQFRPPRSDVIGFDRLYELVTPAAEDAYRAVNRQLGPNPNPRHYATELRRELMALATRALLLEPPFPDRVALLPEPDREIIQRMRIDRQPIADVAAAIGLTEEEVRRIADRALFTVLEP